MDDDRRNAYCATLGVEPTATLAEIQRAYRDLALEYHPDRNPPGSDTAEKFKIIQDAYEALSQPERLPWTGLFHSPWSMFRTTHYCSKSAPDNLLSSSPGLLFPLSAIATVFYLLIVFMCTLLSFAGANNGTDDDYGSIIKIVVATATLLYVLTLPLLVLFFAKR
jgi:hypothetical protein